MGDTVLSPGSLALADWRRQVAELYAAVRQHAEPEEAWRDFRAARDSLFKSHSQSPLSAAQKRGFRALPFYPYDPAWRLLGIVDADVERETFSTVLADDGPFRYTRVARVRFEMRDVPLALSLYWIEGYGGGLFLPFRDASNGHTTYAGGRYLFDTIKGADLGQHHGRLIMDFNFAYNPSCAYDDRWVCPLPLPENRLTVAVEAGEQNEKHNRRTDLNDA
jgi:uncharacterized protein (DUF1684 family)